MNAIPPPRLLTNSTLPHWRFTTAARSDELLAELLVSLEQCSVLATRAIERNADADERGDMMGCISHYDLIEVSDLAHRLTVALEYVA